MPANNSSYEKIQSKIHAMKGAYPSLRTKSDDYVFSALCVKSHLFKNPALVLYKNDFDEMIVDGQYDGGVDVLLTDPNSEEADMVIAQSKFYTSISADDVMNAMTKMASFFKDMSQGHYEQVNAKVQRRFLTLNAELGDESKVHFVFYTSAPQAGINRSRIEKKFREQFTDSSRFEVSFFFGKDVEEEIDESESRRPTVEQGKIKIDSTDNFLLYGDDAAIVNVSAFSIKALYAQYNIQLLAKNLRYHISGRDIDRGIEETIRYTPAGIQPGDDILLDGGGQVKKVHECAVDAHDIHTGRGVLLRVGQHLAQGVGGGHVDVEIERRSPGIVRMEEQREQYPVTELHAPLLIGLAVEILGIDAEVGGAAALHLLEGQRHGRQRPQAKAGVGGAEQRIHAVAQHLPAAPSVGGGAYPVAV